MGRPSIKAERREQILDAYETCVARFGVGGASLEKIAETAGLARPSALRPLRGQCRQRGRAHTGLRAGIGLTVAAR